MGARRNSAETKQSGYAPSSGPESKNGRSSAEDGAPAIGWLVELT